MSLNTLGTGATGYQARKTREELQAQRPLLERLLQEQEQTNKLLWAMLSTDQRAEVAAADAAAAAAVEAAAQTAQGPKVRWGRRKQ